MMNKVAAVSNQYVKSAKRLRPQFQFRASSAQPALYHIHGKWPECYKVHNHRAGNFMVF